jgi:hypothetical protein
MGVMGMTPNMNMMNLNLMDWSEAQVTTMFNGHVDKQELRGVVEYCCKQNNPVMIRDAFIGYLGSSNSVRPVPCLLLSSCFSSQHPSHHLSGTILSYGIPFLLCSASFCLSLCCTASPCS